MQTNKHKTKLKKYVLRLRFANVLINRSSNSSSSSSSSISSRSSSSLVIFKVA